VTFQDLGSIGELLAAIATIATLIYLSIQIRSNTKTVKAENRHRENDAAYLSSIIDNPDVARVWLKGLSAEPDSSPEDAVRFAFLLGMFVATEAAFYDEVQLGIGSASRLDNRKIELMEILITPGGRRWWKRHRDKYGVDFGAYVDSALDAWERDA